MQWQTAQGKRYLAPDAIRRTGLYTVGTVESVCDYTRKLSQYPDCRRLTRWYSLSAILLTDVRTEYFINCKNYGVNTMTTKTAPKATRKANPFKATMTAAQMDKSIKDVCERSKTLQDDVQEVAVAIMLHAYNHGDFTRAQALVTGLGKGIRAKALVDWFHKAGLNVGDNGFNGFNKKVMEKNWEVCKKNPWYTMKPENPFSGFDLDAELTRLIERAEKAIQKNNALPEDAERPENFKMNVSAEQLTALRALITTK
ncbi:coil containing protein [Vibrio phage vB_VpaP_G1]|uniref:Coil containing protein n=1 Tax=Vibrio phage vB_VpaP_G1 TaxID=2862773 RepID=A0AAE7WW73_9CAUD|nr:coil containing protein [Vibrio phage vB_VpaP_G1]QYW05812.1 coil containing protein [Vibrio phage vB_VpaP_G1]